MFIVFLKFSTNKSDAGAFMDAHNLWIKEGFDADIFLLVGSLQTGLGGSIIAHNTTLDELQNRINNDPFVKEDIVRAEILEIDPKMADERLKFLVKS